VVYLCNIDHRSRRWIAKVCVEIADIKGGWNLSRILRKINVPYEEWIDMKSKLFWWTIHRVFNRYLKKPINN